MKTRIIGIALFVVAGCFVAVSIFKAEKPIGNTYPFIDFSQGEGKRNPAAVKQGPREGHVLFALKAGANQTQIRDLQSVIETFDLKVSKKLVEGKVQLAKANKHLINEEELASQLQHTGAVEFAEPDSLVSPSMVTNDPLLSQQWHHVKLGATQAWDTSIGAKGIIVASCDTGVDPTHPDLKSALLAAYNSETNSTANVVPVNPHGTMTAGTMAAVANNSVGVSGIAGAVKILPIKITNFDNGAAYLSAIADCITYAANKGAKVVNLSYGGTESAVVDTAANYLRSKGGMLVVAAGNDSSDTSANTDYASMFVVSATDQSDQLTSWSNRGTPTDIVAPGLDILTTNLGGSYAYSSGTSFAAPMVSGAAALVYSVYASFTPSQVEDILSSTASKAIANYSSATEGAGRLDVAAAVAKAKTLIPKKGRK